MLRHTFLGGGGAKKDCFFKIECTEIELLKENQMADISKHDDELENLLKTERMLNKQVDKLSKEKDDMEILDERISKEIMSLSD